MANCEICDKEFTNLGVHNKFKHGVPGKKEGSTPTSVITDIVQPSKEISQQEGNQLDSVLTSIVGTLNKIDERLTKLEVKGGALDNSFRRGVKSEDVDKAEVTRIGVDDRIVKMVDEILGEDFGIKVEPREGQPGLNFTLLVPRRLSDIPESTRPIKGEDGEYVVNLKTKLPVQETYWPGDERTRAIASHESYDNIREYCEKVRSYLVTYYQKLNRPIPEFKLRNYV